MERWTPSAAAIPVFRRLFGFLLQLESVSLIVNIKTFMINLQMRICSGGYEDLDTVKVILKGCSVMLEMLVSADVLQRLCRVP